MYSKVAGNSSFDSRPMGVRISVPVSEPSSTLVKDLTKKASKFTGKFSSSISGLKCPVCPCGDLTPDRMVVSNYTKKVKK